MSLELKSFEYYDKLKRKFNKNCNIFFKKYISSACIGQCTYLFDKYSPKTADEFIISYTTDCDDNFDTVNFRGSKTKGRSYDDLRSIAHGLYKDLSDNNLLKENNITFEECYDEIINHCIIETFNGKKYELSMSSSEDLPVSEPLDGTSLGTIFPVGFMQNDELMVARVAISTGSETFYPLQIFKKGTNIDDWTLLSPNDLSSNISSYSGNSDLDFIYNPTNQVISISYEKSRNDSYGIPGKAFRFVGINESGKVIFEELPCDVSQFIQTPGSKWEDGVYYFFAPTYSQDCGKYVIAKQIPSHISPDNKSHYQYLVGYATTGIFLKAVKDPSKLGAFAIQGVAKQNIANNGSGQIVTLALEKVNIQLNSDVELDDILVSTGV